MSIQDTPRAERPHIGLFGRRNAGKSSLINALTGQETALVSAVPGTTTDPVLKSFELRGVGPVVFLDTAGLDDEGALGDLRVARTRQAAEKTDLALLVLTDGLGPERAWLDRFRERGVPVVAVLNKCDERPEGAAAALSVVRTTSSCSFVSSRQRDIFRSGPNAAARSASVPQSLCGAS